MEILAYLHSAIEYESSAIFPGSRELIKPTQRVSAPSKPIIQLLVLTLGLSVLTPNYAIALQRNDSGADVTTLQTNLIAAGYYNGPVTGFYGELTELAVISFQQANGLIADGIVGAETLAALERLASSNTPPDSTTDSGNVLRRGASGDAVSTLQTRLTAARFYSGPITGLYGEETEAAVISFQQTYGLTADGVAGPATLAALDVGVPTTQGFSTSQPPSSPGDTPQLAGNSLQRGVSDEAVTDLQTILALLGYYDGEITGFFGEQTEAAVIRFQQDNGLTADGIVGPSTVTALRNETASVPDSPDSDRSLAYGDNGASVVALQEALSAKGYYQGPITGEFGDLTQAALINYQRDNGLTPDGIAGPATLSTLLTGI